MPCTARSCCQCGTRAPCAQGLPMQHYPKSCLIRMFVCLFDRDLKRASRVHENCLTGPRPRYPDAGDSLPVTVSSVGVSDDILSVSDAEASLSSSGSPFGSGGAGGSLIRGLGPLQVWFTYSASCSFQSIRDAVASTQSKGPPSRNQYARTCSSHFWKQRPLLECFQL